MLINKIKDDMFAAKKAGEASKLDATVLNVLYAEAVKIGKDKGNRETTDEEVVTVIKKLVKGVQETKKLVGEGHAQFSNLDREETLLSSYLPKQLTEDELRVVILSLGTTNMGEIMKHLKENHAGLYDGKVASEIVKSIQ